MSTLVNDDECRNQNFSILPMTRVMDLNSLPFVDIFFFIYYNIRLGVCPKVNSDECRKQNFFISDTLMTRVMDDIRRRFL